MKEKKYGGRKYYADYVEHMIRYYLAKKDGITISECTSSDMKNWVAVNTVLRMMGADENRLVEYVYGAGEILKDNVKRYAEQRSIEQSAVWSQVRKIRDKIAKMRGLI